MEKLPTLIVIAGPTAVGKTAFSIDLALALGSEIISADSRQFYKEMHIGTAKPVQNEMKGVAHHFIGFISVQDYYSAGMFELDVLRKLDVLFEKHPLVILTGGSGLYIKAVCKGMNEIPNPDLSIREQLYLELENKGLDVLRAELSEKDPVYCQSADLNNPQRIIRALEVIRDTGKPYSAYRSDKSVKRPFRILKIGLDRDREELYQRINDRVDQMMKGGLLEEAKSLWFLKHLNALQTVGYRELFAYLDGQSDFEEAIRLLKRNSRRYAKRQLTWFKADPEMQWFHPDQLAEAKQWIEQQL
ncbi:MAG: tRNA (adenosine(37)-N6)-dimethylallyltransferase MiaA [Cyclobacteriaceae bacterium]|nr:tRNA (adenosine(37)-N6)-dimethylallyltransferase MiaA [Cyclobacteriaceae bacterium]